MTNQKTSMGGFVAFNGGHIENSYSVMDIKGKNRLSGGFVAENSGTIEKSYSCGRLAVLVGGFVARDTGNTEKSCYCLHSEKEGSRRLQKLSDSVKAQRLDELKDNDTVASLGFDTTEIWEYLGKEIPIGFISEKWMYPYQAADAEPLVISSVDELIAWGQRVNEGDRSACNAVVVLEKDLDLGGREWIPIGENRTSAFCGVFDGQGHTVKNFLLKNKKRENKGFFGFLKGQVYNLSVDCSIKGGNCMGGLAAQNEGGIIGCCSAVVGISAKQGTMGGLVGRNTGTIFESYSAGKMTAIVIPVWWVIPILGILLLLLFVLKPDSILPTFAPVPYDKDQIPIAEDKGTPNTDGNFVSFQFEQEISVALNTGLCNFKFKNPGNSNHNIVVQLQFTDAQAIRVMGSTGRSQAEQQKLEATPGYDPETYRMVIAESGAIRPGYQLEDLKLVTFENGATLPEGSYNAMVYLVFYDIETNDRAMLESQLPVVIDVKPFV